MNSPADKNNPTKPNLCESCFQIQSRCFCNKIISQKPKHRVIILQYPREQFKPLNSAALVKLSLERSVLVRGLSWRNLTALLDEQIDPKEWAALFFKPHTDTSRPMIAVDRHKNELENISQIKGIIVLDGTWKQAKTLWWRNPWLLKINRITLNPNHPSLRRQANSKYLSTVEAVAMTLGCLGEDKGIVEGLIENYQKCIVGK